MFSIWAEDKQQLRDMGGASTEVNAVAVHRAGAAEGFSVVPGTERALPLLLLLCFNCLAQCLLALSNGGQLMLDLLHTAPPLWQEDLEDLEKVKGSPTLRC